MPFFSSVTNCLLLEPSGGVDAPSSLMHSVICNESSNLALLKIMALSIPAIGVRLPDPVADIELRRLSYCPSSVLFECRLSEDSFGSLDWTTEGSMDNNIEGELVRGVQSAERGRVRGEFHAILYWLIYIRSCEN